MANPITFQGVAAPDFRSSNSMQNEAVKSLLLAGQQIKDAVGAYTQKRVDRNQALLQDYINQAKTPEELQSESFKQGYANLVSSFKGEVDPLKASGYLDGRIDSLTKRAADQTSVEANRFRLEQDQLNAPTQAALLKTQLSGAEEALRFAQANNPNVIAKNKIDADVALATQGDLISNKKLVNQQILENMANDRRRLQLEAERIANEKERIANASNPFKFETSVQGLLSETGNNIRNFEADMIADRAKAMGDTAKDATAWYKEKGSIWHGLPKTLKNLVEGKYPSANITGLKDLTPAQLYDVMDKTYSKVDTGFNVPDKDFETVKKVFQNEVNTALRGDVDKRNAYAFAQIDNMLNEAYLRNPKIDALKVLKELNIDPKLKEAYFQSKQDEVDAAKAEEVLRKQGSQQVAKAVPSYTLPLSSPAMDMQGIVDPSLLLMYENRLRNR